MLWSMEEMIYAPFIIDNTVEHLSKYTHEMKTLLHC